MDTDLDVDMVMDMVLHIHIHTTVMAQSSNLYSTIAGPTFFTEVMIHKTTRT